MGAHERWLTRLPELGADVVVGTAPRNIAGKRFNCAYLWTKDGALHWIHQKTYLPNDSGYWEASWYDRAPVDFQPFRVGTDYAYRLDDLHRDSGSCSMRAIMAKAECNCC